jgi:hypothetical protein
MKLLEKLVTLAIPEHDISHSAKNPFAGESHFLKDNYSILLSRKAETDYFQQRRKDAKILCAFAALRENCTDVLRGNAFLILFINFTKTGYDNIPVWN